MVKQHTRETYELLFDSAAGDIEAYKELFERYSEKLYNFVYYLTYSREESEDITSETFIKVFEALQGRDVASFNFQAYLYKTAKNLSLNAIARKKREGLSLEEAEDFADASIFSDPEKVSLLSDQREKVKSASGQLTEDQQAALLLKELENLPYGTIAEVLDSNPNAVGALLSRARLKFKEVYRMTHAQTEGIPDACEKITPLLSAYIDKEASPQERRMIEDHLASCPICNANLESMQEASTTYRSLIPILPLATFKVWSVAKGGLIGGKVAVGAAASVGAAGAGSAVAGATTAAPIAATGASTAAFTQATTAATTGSTGIMAAIGSSLAYKVIAVVVAGLIVVGIGVGGYYATTKKVPTSLTEEESTSTGQASKVTGSSTPDSVVRSFCRSVASRDYEGAQEYCASSALVNSIIQPDTPTGRDNPDWFIVDGAPHFSVENLTHPSAKPYFISSFGTISETKDISSVSTKSGKSLERSLVIAECYFRMDDGTEQSMEVLFNLVKENGSWQIIGDYVMY